MLQLRFEFTSYCFRVYYVIMLCVNRVVSVILLKRKNNVQVFICIIIFET